VELPKKPKFFGNLPSKIEIFSEITLKEIRNSSEICLENRSFVKLHEKKSKFFGNLL